MCRWLVALALAAAPAPAAMASPIVVGADAGFRFPLGDPSMIPDEHIEGHTDGSATVGAFGATIAYRISPRIAIGVRGRASWRKYRTADTSTHYDVYYCRYSEIPIDVALAMTYELGRIWN